MTMPNALPGKRAGTLRSVLPATMIGAIAGIDNIALALAMGALLFAGPLAPGIGLGVGVILFGGAILALVVALRSVVPNSVALVQEATIAILATALVSAQVQAIEGTQAKIATAIAVIGASSVATGILFWLTGRLRVGGLVRFLPYPVVAGFLAGSGWLLVDGAAVMLTGHEIGFEALQALALPEVALRVAPAILFAAVLLASMSRYVHPATMPLVMIAAVLAFYLTLSATGTPVEAARDMGHLPRTDTAGRVGLPTLELVREIDWLVVLSVAPIIAVVAGLNLIGLMLNTSGLELAIGRDIDVNAELRSAGLANMLSGAVGGPSGYAGLSMTILAQKTGARGRGAGIATAAVMLVGLVWAGTLIALVPAFITGGFVLFLGAELMKEWLFDARKRMPRAEWLIVAAILLTVASIGFMEGLIVGLVVSSGLFVFKYARLPVVRLHATGAEQRSTVDRAPTEIKYLSDHGDAIEIIHLQGYLFFGTAERVVDLVRRRLNARDRRPLQFLALDFRDVSGADSAAITCFAKINRLAGSGQFTVYLTRTPEELRHHLVLAGIRIGDGELMRFEADLDQALEKAEESLLSAQRNSATERSILDHFAAAVGPHPRFADLVDNMTRLELEPEDAIIRQGEDANDVFFVASGRVRVQVTLPDGQILRLRTMLAGAIIGEIALYLNQPRTADVIVDAPSVILRLDAEDMVRLEREDAELSALAHRLMACNLSEKLSVANKMIQVTRK